LQVRVLSALRIRKKVEVAEENERASEDLVEKAKADAAKTRNPLQRASLFIRQVLAELSKVTRPTRQELVKFTGVVLGFVAVIMVIISLLDWIFLNVVTFVFAD
jgi:preprotein translocase subunit SecE